VLREGTTKGAEGQSPESCNSSTTLVVAR